MPDPEPAASQPPDGRDPDGVNAADAAARLLALSARRLSDAASLLASAAGLFDTCTELEPGTGRYLSDCGRHLAEVAGDLTEAERVLARYAGAGQRQRARVLYLELRPALVLLTCAAGVLAAVTGLLAGSLPVGGYLPAVLIGFAVGVTAVATLLRARGGPSP